MTLQNRVTPFGDIVAIPQRGLFTGNRGILHDPATRTLLGRPWASKAWLVCNCRYKGRRRAVMSGRSWTELFFLDEAVALAAGHRPCFVCRREAAMAFRAAWASAAVGDAPRAAAMDAVLHGERFDRRHKAVHPLAAKPASLPDGAMVAAGGEAFTIAHGMVFRWTDGGYASPVELRIADRMLTPPSTLAALLAGSRPVLHPAIASFRDGQPG